MIKKILVGVALAISFAAQATTYNSIQLLNPAGSTAGQAIVSSGATTAPAWGAVTAGALAPIGANTLLGNATASTAAPAAFAVPTCSAAGSVLHWVAGRG